MYFSWFKMRFSAVRPHETRLFSITIERWRSDLFRNHVCKVRIYCHPCLLFVSNSGDYPSHCREKFAVLSAKLVLMDIEQKFERWQKARHLVHLDSTGICQYRSFFTSYRQEYAYFRLFPRSKAAPSLGQTIIRPSVTQVTAVKQSASQSPLSRITDTFCPWCLIEVKSVYWALYLHLFLPPWNYQLQLKSSI